MWAIPQKDKQVFATKFKKFINNKFILNEIYIPSNNVNIYFYD